MPVPAEADKKDSNNQGLRTEQQTASPPSNRVSSINAGVPASPPAPSAPVSAPSNEQAASPGAEESCGNGGPGVTSPIEMANGDPPQ